MRTNATMKKMLVGSQEYAELIYFNCIQVVRLLGPKGMGLPDHEALAVEAVSELKDLDSTHVCQ